MAADWHGGTAVADPARQRRSASSVLLPAACAGAIAALAWWWLAATPQAVLREQLRVGQFWFLEGLFLSLVITSTLAGRELLRALDLPSKRLLVGITCAAATLVLAAPRTNRIFYDEQIYQSIGQNLSDLHRAQMCNDGTVEYGVLQCWRPEYNKQPYGYPYLISLAYRWLGTSDTAAHRLNLLTSGATAGAIFLLTLLLTRDRLPAGLAALAFTLLPEQLRWAHAASAEPTAALACTGAVLAAAAFVRFRSSTALAWMAVATSWAAYVRMEGILILAVAALIVLLYARQEVARPRFAWMAISCLVLLLPASAHLAAVQNESWGSIEGRFALPFFWTNVASNTAFYLGDRRFPVLFTALALAGLTLSRTTTLLIAWFGIFWGVFLFFYAGSYDYGADVRFSLMSHPPLAMLAGIGTARILRFFGVGAHRIAGPVAVALFLFQFGWYLPWVRSVGEEAWAARADVAFARQFAQRLPANAIVLTHNPGMFHVWGISAAQLSIAAGEPAYVRETLSRRYAGGVYLHWSFWCNVRDVVQREFCDRALVVHPSRLVGERWTRDYRNAFYRLTP